MSHDVRTLATDEFVAANALFAAAIHRGPTPEAQHPRVLASYSPGRALGVHEDGALVATATSFPSETLVPGGAVLPVAAVTRVGVRADHTRRGLLTAMMRAQLDDVAERGEPLATLRASEARIYGRFGYGVATRGRSVRVRADREPLRPGAPLDGSVRMLERQDVVPTLRKVHENIALRRTGGMTRTEAWWRGFVERRIDDGEHIIAALHTGRDGDDGLAVAFVGESTGGFAGRTLALTDLHAADVSATAALWRFLLSVDLVGAVQADLRPLDEPLELLLTDPRACVVTGQDDETWLRLVDVPAALAARSYGTAEPLLLAVHDPFLERNAGVYRIADGSAERVGPLGGPVHPDLECSAAALSMVYLGDRVPSELVGTGWWQVNDAAAVPRADAAFATAETPWCGTFF
ncbi:GNAT family N-acetyltransferase [Pseudonocardia aurantiaca]|uniref:GNAT family N-acetyltransferase n=1 Tax=Pseudonocardia aurantiaca TaxID=75290 RepID=A0ABW4FGC9_9PSEU